MTGLYLPGEAPRETPAQSHVRESGLIVPTPAPEPAPTPEPPALTATQKLQVAFALIKRKCQIDRALSGQRAISRCPQKGCGGLLREDAGYRFPDPPRRTRQMLRQRAREMQKRRVGDAPRMMECDRCGSHCLVNSTLPVRESEHHV